VPAAQPLGRQATDIVRLPSAQDGCTAGVPTTDHGGGGADGPSCCPLSDHDPDADDTGEGTGAATAAAAAAAATAVYPYGQVTLHEAPCASVPLTGQLPHPPCGGGEIPVQGTPGVCKRRRSAEAASSWRSFRLRARSPSPPLSSPGPHRRARPTIVCCGPPKGPRTNATENKTASIATIINHTGATGVHKKCCSEYALLCAEIRRQRGGHSVTFPRVLAGLGRLLAPGRSCRGDPARGAVLGEH
jgi:hypothetical protein